MFNIDDTLFLLSDYNKQRDLYLKIFKQLGGVLSFVEILRAQVSEINLLQLIPGFYLILLFLSLSILCFFSDYFLFSIVEKDFEKKIGTKTISKKRSLWIKNAQYFFFSTILLLVLNTVIPIGLDSFNSYDEKTLEDLWSFDEVISLEVTLLIILIFLSQCPIFVIESFTTEKDRNYLFGFGKLLGFISFLVAGILTPTIDGYTQISFAFSTLFLYSLVLYFLQRSLDNQNILFVN